MPLGLEAARFIWHLPDRYLRDIVLVCSLLLFVALSACTLLPTPPPPAELLPAPTTAPGAPSLAHVRFVRMTEETGGTWRFDVTVQHEDESEAHFVDRWEILIPLPDGQTLSYARPFTQPHLDEQPFETSLSGIQVPEGTTQLWVRARDSLHGYGGQEVVVDLSAAAGPGFQVIRK
jgi:hypothetical protein